MSQTDKVATPANENVEAARSTSETMSSVVSCATQAQSSTIHDGDEIKPTAHPENATGSRKYAKRNVSAWVSQLNNELVATPSTNPKQDSLQALAPLVMDNTLNDYGPPLKVQDLVMEQVFAGKNFIITSPSPTGKTRAALNPIVSEVIDQKPAQAENINLRSTFNRDERPAPCAIFITPTHETAMQTYCEATRVAHGSQVGIALLKGSRRARKDQLLTMRSGCDILITTMGALMHALPEISMESLRRLVIDEAHELLQD